MHDPGQLLSKIAMVWISAIYGVTEENCSMLLR
jgi:hypothetical protein